MASQSDTVNPMILARFSGRVGERRRSFRTTPTPPRDRLHPQLVDSNYCDRVRFCAARPVTDGALDDRALGFRRTDLRALWAALEIPCTAHRRGVFAQNLRNLLRFAESISTERSVSALRRHFIWTHIKTLIQVEAPSKYYFPCRSSRSYADTPILCSTIWIECCSAAQRSLRSSRWRW